MLNPCVFNPKSDTKKTLLCPDSIVEDVIAEHAPDVNDRKKRWRRANSSSFSVRNKLNNVPAANLGDLSATIEKPFAISFNADDRIEFNESSNHYGDVNILPLTEGNSSTLLLQNKEIIMEKSEDRGIVNKESSPDIAEAKGLEKKIFALLNAKIEDSKDPTLSATARWQNVIADRNASENLGFEVESDGSLRFYILDAYEEIYGDNAGNLYLFGKVKSGGTYHSCCVVVKNMQRCVYAIPTVSFLHNDTVQELEKKLEESRMALVAAKDQLVKQGRDVEKSRTPSTDLKDMVDKLQKDVEESQTVLRNRLHELASDMKTEIAKELLERNVSSFSMAPVKRNYAFERSDIPHGENYVLKINYPFKDQPLPLHLKGNNFRALLGTHSSCLELFLIKRKIMGPSWLSISKFSTCAAAQRVSWCKFEVTVDFTKDIQVSTSSKNVLEIPPVVVAAINLKTIINEKNVNEIVAASVICCHKAKIDSRMVASEWTRPGMLGHFTVVRKLEGGIFPMGFAKEAPEKTAKAGSNVICYESNERALLNRLVIEIHKLDSDVLVGHNISGFDLDVLLHRVQASPEPFSML